MEKYGYIFDFDGVLVNTMEIHYRYYKQALAEYGVEIDKEQFYKQAGMTAREQIEYFCKKSGAKHDWREIYKRKGEIALETYEAGEPIENNIRLFKILKRANCKIAIASGGSRNSVRPVAEKHGLVPDAFVNAEDVERGKPNPDLFLKDAERIGVKPENCVVIEDSDAGIAAARAAGMKSMRFIDNKE